MWMQQKEKIERCDNAQFDMHIVVCSKNADRRKAESAERTSSG
jgi:hypothetical protein